MVISHSTLDSSNIKNNKSGSCFSFLSFDKAPGQTWNICTYHSFLKACPHKLAWVEMTSRAGKLLNKQVVALFPDLWFHLYSRPPVWSSLSRIHDYPIKGITAKTKCKLLPCFIPLSLCDDTVMMCFNDGSRAQHKKRHFTSHTITITGFQSQIHNDAFYIIFRSKWKYIYNADFLDNKIYQYLMDRSTNIVTQSAKVRWTTCITFSCFLTIHRQITLTYRTLNCNLFHNQEVCLTVCVYVQGTCTQLTMQRYNLTMP